MTMKCVASENWISRRSRACVSREYNAYAIENGVTTSHSPTTSSVRARMRAGS